ncbi:metalloregulator ArsR/SmtB family transcription factor [Gaiella sp.]|uniref:ArsR/SmtB family transcription factor n=1 Tax=Gaiella sp. TaxID=2663207 RepID=UPI00326415FF
MSTSPEAAACCTPLSTAVMSDEGTNATAELFKVLGDPARVRIVNMIAVAGSAICACDFYDALGLGQPTVSYHLKKLTDVGLLEREQRGKWAFFSLNEEAVEKLAAVADLKVARC